MCIALFTESKKLITAKLISQNWRGAGAGLMYHNDGKLIVKTSLMTPQSVTSALEGVPDCRPVAVHLRRVRTLSSLPENTHPHKISDRRYIMQVGTFARGNPDSNPKYCETKQLAKLLGKLEHGEQNFFLAGLAKNPNVAFVTATEKDFSRWGSTWRQLTSGLYIVDSNYFA